MKLKTVSVARLTRNVKVLSALFVAAAGINTVGRAPYSQPGQRAMPTARQSQPDTAAVLRPVAGAKTGTYEEVSRIITRPQWQVLNTAQRGLIRNMLMDARTGSAPFEACFAPGTQPEVIRAFEAATRSLNAFRLSGHWTQTVNTPSVARGQAMKLTWSIVPDGTVFSSGYTTDIGTERGTGKSDVRAWAVSTYGSLEAFKTHLRSVFSKYEQISGVRYMELSADDGAALPNSPGVAGVRGDIRIAGRFIDNNSDVLAYTFLPNSGDMVIDTNDDFYTNDRANVSTGLRGLLNALAHEHGHGLGLGHVFPDNQTKLMEWTVSYAFEGPQWDDIMAVQRNYGDVLESPSGNDSTGTATNLGTLGIGTASRTTLSIDGDDDIDVFRFTKDAGNRAATVTVTPLGTPYLESNDEPGLSSEGTLYDPRNRRNLIVELLDGNGNVMARADNTAAGAAETLPLTGLTSSANHYVRVSGYGIDAIQMYKVDFTLAARTNVAPSVIVALSPATATTTTSLTASITKTDPEGNPLTQTIRWLANGVVIPGQTTTSLNLGAISTVRPGDLISIEVTVEDGNGASGRGAATIRLDEPGGLIVTTLADVTADDGETSLREAYATALTRPASPAPEITFQKGLAGTVELTSSLPQLTRQLKITGPGHGTIVLSGDYAWRFLVIGPSGTLQVSGLIFQNFYGDKDDLTGAGAVFYINGGNLSATDCIFRENTAFNTGGVVFVPQTATSAPVLNFTNCAFLNGYAWYGSAVLVEKPGATLTMTRCMVRDNETESEESIAPGAIVAADTTVTLTASTFDGNYAPAGAALHIFDVSGRSTVIDSCTFSGNYARGGNGGAILDGTQDSAGYGTLTVRNSTFNYNRAVGDGGAIWDSGGASRLTNNTFSNNEAGGWGNALARGFHAATLTNNIFHRGDIDSTRALLEASPGTFTSGGGNVFSDASPTFFTKLANDKTGVDPQLSPQSDNGGLVKTMALGATSPAANAGTDAVLGAPDSLTTDGRGAGFPRKQGTAVDSGAFERPSGADSSAPVVTFTDPIIGGTSLEDIKGIATDDTAVASVTLRIQRAADGLYWTGTAWGALTELRCSFYYGTPTSREWEAFTQPQSKDITAGDYTLTATVTDSSNKTGTATRAFSTTKTQLPTIEFTAPGPDSGTTITALPAISGKATHNVGLTSVTFRLQRASDGLFWTGTAWGAATELVPSLGGSATNRTWTRTSGLPGGANLPLGGYRLTAKATSTSNSTATATHSFIVKAAGTKPPTLAITAPAANAVLPVMIPVTGTATDDVSVTDVTLRLQRVSDNKYWSGYVWWASPLNFAVDMTGPDTNRSWATADPLPVGADFKPGSYKLIVTAIDSDGFTATETRTFSGPVANVAPKVAFTAPAAGATVNPLAAVSGTATDDVTVSSVTFKLMRNDDGNFWNGTSWGSDSDLTTTLSGPVTSRAWTRNTGLPAGADLQAGSYTLTAKATDSGGLTASASRNFTAPAPNEAPTLDIYTPATGTSINALPEVSGAAFDDVTVSKVTFTLKRGSDNLFWTGSAWGAETAITTSLSGQVNAVSWIRTSGLPTGANLNSGNYTLTATATDSGAVTATATSTFTVVNVPPTIIIDTPAAGEILTSLPAVSGTAEDDVSISKVTFTLRRNSDSTYWTGSAWGAETAISATISGSPSFVGWTRTSGLPAGANLSPGGYTLSVTATDSAALTATATRNFTVPNVPPTVAFTAPASGTSLTTLSAVSGTATDDFAVSGVTIRLQRTSDSKYWTGSAWGAVTELATTLGGTVTNHTWTRNTGLPASADLIPGSYTLTVTATDSSAATVTATRAFTVPVPNAPPAVAFTAPDSGTSIIALPAVSGTATDDFSVTKITLRIQRASDGKFWTGSAWGVSTELTTALTGAVNNRVWTRNSDLPFGGNLAPGSYTLTATATDGGALTGTATRSFTVPTPSAPTVAFTAPASGASLGSLTTVSGTVTDALGISGVTFRLQRASDGKFWTGSAWGASTELTTTPAGTLTDGTWSRSADLPAGTDLLAGSYTLTATATNTSAVTTTATRSFTVPVPTAPVVAFTAPAAGANLTGVPAVSGTATDDVLVTAVTFRIQRASDSKFWTGSAWGASTELTTTLSGTPTSRTWTRTTDLPFGANLVAGSYTLTATATNGSALTGTATQGFTVPVPTAGAAVVATVTTPVNGSSIKVLTLANGTVVDKTGGSGVSKVEITLQRVTDAAFWNGSLWTYETTHLPTGVSGNTWSKGAFPAAGSNPDTQLLEGKYIITAKATNLTGDVSANTATSKTQFTVDRSVPTDLVIINPVFNGKLKGVPKLNGTVKDNLGVASVQLILQRSTDAKSWNGTTWVAAQTLLATNVAGPVTDRVWSLSTGLPTGENLVLGTYALTAIATDYAGNKTTLPWRFVITEGDRPTVTITSPANATTISSLTTISGVAGDTGGSSLASVQLTLRRMSDNTYWKGSSWVPESSILPTQVTAVTAFNFNWFTTVLPKGADLLDGVYRAQATAFDRAGNISSIYQVQFTYKKAAALTRSSRVALSSANAAGGEDGLIQLLFTGALGGSATDAANYSVTLDGEPVEVFSARQKSPGLVVLTTGGLAAGSRVAVNYYLQDTGGGSIPGTASVIVR